MTKLTKLEYILKAAKLYGLGNVEIEALREHIDGTNPNPFIERKTDFLFRLYDIYKEDNGETIRKRSDGVIDLNDFYFEKSKRRLADSKIGEFWVIGANLSSYLVTLPSDTNNVVRHKFRGISEKNNFLLPQVAEAMGLDTTLYYRCTFSQATNDYYHLAKGFIQDIDDTFIRGTEIVKDSRDKKKVKLESLLEATDKYIKKHYKKYNFSEDKTAEAREQIRRELIKQSFFNKYVFNEKESNEKWGLIEDGNHELRVAPLFSFDFCAGAEPSGKVRTRTVNGREDIQTFMLKYGKEEWFRTWVKEKVINMPSINDLSKDMEEETGIKLTSEEREYYSFMFKQFKVRVKEIVDIDYDEKELSKMERLRNRKKDVRKVGVNRRNLPANNSAPEDHDEN